MFFSTLQQLDVGLPKITDHLDFVNECSLVRGGGSFDYLATREAAHWNNHRNFLIEIADS
jgi:hypothetical protein